MDRLGIVKIRHLQEIHHLSYKNTCRIIATHLRPFINETYYQKEKVMTLNKKGRDLIASERDDIKINQHTIHSLLRNEVYIHFDCPNDWKNEYVIKTPINDFLGVKLNSLTFTLPDEKTIISDAVFKRNGWVHLIEVDNTQDMRINQKKIESYKEVIPSLKGDPAILHFFTTTEKRKRKLEEWMKGMRHEVQLFDEIK
jgi:hypothetical protein